MLFASLLLAAGSLTALGMPSAPGTVWRYRATVEWTLDNSNRVRSATVTWTTSVVASQVLGGRQVIVVRGFPTDLCWYTPSIKPSLTVLTLARDGLYLHKAAATDDAAGLLAKASGEQPLGELVLRTNPRLGDCVSGTPERTDGLYCWNVQRIVRYRGRKGWSVAYRALPDHQVISFIPGVGVTAFEFAHHGTVASARAKLTSVHPPAK
jgi:hypothetical protein